VCREQTPENCAWTTEDRPCVREMESRELSGCDECAEGTRERKRSDCLAPEDGQFEEQSGGVLCTRLMASRVTVGTDEVVWVGGVKH
jgi:hypothetical protein